MKRTKSELLEQVRAIIGEDTSDNALNLLSDLSDTIDDYEKSSSGGEDWKKKYEENDAQWRQKYKERFFAKIETKEDSEDNEPSIEEPKEEQKTKFEELFN